MLEQTSIRTVVDRRRNDQCIGLFDSLHHIQRLRRQFVPVDRKVFGRSKAKFAAECRPAEIGKPSIASPSAVS